MKKTLIILSLLVALSINACNKKENTAVKDETANEAQALVDRAEFTEKGLLGMIADKKAVTAVEYEALLRSVEQCELDEKTLDFIYACPALKAIRAFDDNDDYVMAEGVDVKNISLTLLTSKIPKVQARSIAKMGNIFGLNEEDQARVLDIGKTATEPILIKAIIESLATKMSNKAVTDFVLSHVDHKTPAVRYAVIDAVTDPHSKEVDGITDIALKLINDEDQDVRSHALERIGGLGDDRVIAPLVAILNDKEQFPLHGSCMQSLYTMWYDYPEHGNTSEKAYIASLEYLKQTPRTDDAPEWRSVSSTENISKDKIEAWKAKASYFNLSEFLPIMSDIATDVNANSLTRTTAVDVLHAWGSKKELEDLKAKLASDNSQSTAYVMRHFDEVTTGKNDI